MESITKELRDWAKTLTHWWYDPVKDEYTYTTGIMPPSIDAIRLDRNILAIADRIDEAHERELRETGEDIVRDVRRDWVKLPVDADGVPIRVGDVLDPPADCDDYMPLQVVRLTYDGFEEEWYFDGQAGGFTGMVGKCMDVAGWTHHHEPTTVEDVLREMLCVWEDTLTSEGVDGIISEYAKKLRLAGDAE